MKRERQLAFGKRRLRKKNIKVDFEETGLEDMDDISSSEKGLVACSCKRGNEPSGF